MSNFDIKSFLINEGLTRVSRDRKKLLKEGFEEGADLTKRILNVIQRDDELGQVLEVRPGHQWEDVIGDWEPEEVTVETEHGSDDPMQVEPGRYIFVDGDFKWDLEDEVGEEIPWTYYIWYSGPTASYVTYMYRLPEDLDESRKPATTKKQGDIHHAMVSAMPDSAARRRPGGATKNYAPKTGMDKATAADVKKEKTASFGSEHGLDSYELKAKVDAINASKPKVHPFRKMNNNLSRRKNNNR